MRVPEVLESLRQYVVLTDEVCNAIEVHAKQSLQVRLWRVSGVLKPWHDKRDVLRTCEIQGFSGMESTAGSEAE